MKMKLTTGLYIIMTTVFVLIFFVNMYTINYFNNFIVTEFDSKRQLSEQYYINQIDKNYNQDIVNVVSKYCELYNDQLTQIKCVVKFVIESEKFEYKITNKVILSDKLFESGGDCKSWSVFYLTVFDKMGYYTKPVTITEHVYVVVQTDNHYCTIDQTYIDCVNLK